MKTTPIDKLLEECELLEVDNDHEGILEYTELILKGEPQNSRALSYRAMSLYELESYDEALECTDRILEIAPDSRYFKNFKIQILSRLGRSSDAYGFYTALTDDEPDKDTVEMLAHSLIDDGDCERALECLDRLNEENWLFNYRIIDGYKRIKRHSDIESAEEI